MLVNSGRILNLRFDLLFNSLKIPCIVSEHESSVLTQAGFWQGARDSRAIMLTYLPVSFAFGVSATQFGFTARKLYFYPAPCMLVPVSFL